MSCSAFVRLVDQAAQALEMAPGLAGVPVFKNRLHPLSREQAAGITVRLVSSRRAVDGPLGAQDWETALEIECGARGVTGEDPATAADDLLMQAWFALVGAPMKWPGVTDVDSEPGIEWDFESADTPLAVVTLRLAIRHRTAINQIVPLS